MQGSVYSTGVEAYRETTKWLAAFVPVTSLVTAAAVSGPKLIRSIQAAPSLGAWVQRYWLVLLCAVGLFGGIGAILWFGARVLRTEPADIGDLATGQAGAQDLAHAIGSGVAAPEFFSKGTFDVAMSELANAWDTGELVGDDDPRLTRLRPAVEALREWSVFHRIQRTYRDFGIAFVAAAVVISIAILLAPAQLGSGAPIDEPTRVEIGVDAAGREDLAAHTGCTTPDSSSFFAVGGTWDQPQLAVDGPGCRFGATWKPDPAHIELRVPVA